MPPAPSLSLEKLAAIDAQIAAGLPRDRVLAEAGITAEAFDRAHEAWFARMASEATHGKSRKLHKRYHDALRAQRKEAQRQTTRKVEGKTPAAPVARLSPLAAQYRPDAPKTAQKKVDALPEVRLQSAPPPPVVVATPATSASGDDPLMRTVTVTQSPLRPEAALPFQPSPTRGAGAKPAKPKRETLELKAIDEQTLLHTVPSKAALPFAPAGHEDNPLEQTQFSFRSVPRKDAPARKPATIDDEQTRVATTPRKDALPFTQQGKPATIDDAQTQVPIRTPTKDALPFVPQQPVDNPLEINTQAVRPGPRKDPLPFTANAAPPPPRATPTAFDPQKNTGLPFQAPAPQNPTQVPKSNTALPFQRPMTSTGQTPAAVPAEHLDLSRYACLCAELAAFPQESERVFARYGLAEPRLRATVDATWRQRLGEDPQLYRKWQEYYQHYYREWFAKGRRP